MSRRWHGRGETCIAAFVTRGDGEDHELVLRAVGEPGNCSVGGQRRLEPVVGGANREVGDEVVEQSASSEIGCGPDEIDLANSGGCSWHWRTDRTDRGRSNYV